MILNHYTKVIWGLLRMDEKRVLSMLDQLDRYYKELQETIPRDFKNFQETIIKRSNERITQLLIEICIDISNLLFKELKLGLPEEEENVFEILAKNKVISKSMSNKLKRMKRFRNILIHRYGQIDDRLVYENINKNKKDFIAFKKEILEFVKEQKFNK